MWIEKEDGKKRPIGKACCEDKRVQRAVVRSLEALFEPDWQAFAHGCRKGHRPHQALHALREQCWKQHIPWRVDAEVRGVVDTLAWSHLRAFMQQRVNEGGIVRLLGKWLHAGVLEAGALSSPDRGTPQGGELSPMGSHVCLHRVLDEWLVTEGQPRLQGRCFLTRFADDFIIGCERAADARRVMAVLPKRCNRSRLPMHPATTAFMACKQPPSRAPSARGTGRFDWLGFTH